MVFVMGINMPDKKLARVALQAFYGVGERTADRLCARLQIHRTQRVRNLTQNQITGLTSFLSSPQAAPALPRSPLAQPGILAPSTEAALKAPQLNKKDPLLKIRIESELKREIRENIAHQRMIGSYVGRRHAMGLPVRGQNTQNNAKNAKKFNRIERWH
ncbi:S13-like H2TH domain-containing protein [Fomitiporia mediterranea MF3/22]|uniref:S13-like H2TH domain-containing protein n=1 Tax=Fomitiporia mediterranea (strain MF3/22) TaxID=694068 RepID=UPI0004408990|nr:S13-like H2TH domain-containing protein [Fomitiporia mediterranea MF3/22]EJD02456.1 S13-like H2TH domain-containing protein [Fomitiporia mediterranea MF3/22]